MRQATTVRLWISLPAQRGQRTSMAISLLCDHRVALAGADTHREEALLRAPEGRGSIRWCLAGYPDQTPVRVVHTRFNRDRCARHPRQGAAYRDLHPRRCASGGMPTPVSLV